MMLLHGIPGSGAVWSAVADRLADDRDIIVPDLLGFGGSARPRALDDIHAVAQARAVSELIDELGIKRIVVAGHDFGGPVALTLHAMRPASIAAIALLATNVFSDTPIPFPLSSATWPMLGGTLSRVVFSTPSLGAMVRFGVGRPRVRLDTATYLGDRGQRRSIRTIFAGSLTHLEELYGPIEEELGRLAVPKLVGWADRDPFFPLAQGDRTAAAAETTLRVYKGAGHFLPEERPAEVAADLAQLAAEAAPS